MEELLGINKIFLKQFWRSEDELDAYLFFSKYLDADSEKCPGFEGSILNGRKKNLEIFADALMLMVSQN